MEYGITLIVNDAGLTFHLTWQAIYIIAATLGIFGLISLIVWRMT